ncbi:MAG: bile acid:sodium symporter family protein [Bacteroidales bacterium]|nr:bile acid:sodium symporter family protein [Bacteroidales bacterium]
MLRSIYKLSSFVSANITLIVLLVTGVALLLPESFMWIGTASITPMLGVVMFGMGLTLKPADFKPVLMRPKDIIIGEFAQFIVMPLVAWILCKILQLPAELALGVILVGCCPGGTASNVICYLANGDIALSVAMTGVSTLLAPLVTPALVYILAGEEVNVDVIGMFLSIVEVVIIPILLGFIVNRYLGRFTEKVTPLLPLVSTIAIAVIIGIVVSHNSANILSCSLLVGVAVILHNILGLVLGYMAGRMMGLPHSKRTAIAIEVGMQNSGLATSLAATHFAMYPLAAVPGAIFSAWHNFSGSIAASILRKKQ